MTTFLIIWFGQAVSMLGTGLTRFALLIWAYRQTGQATTLALLGFFSFAVFVIVSPLAGVWADRWDRRRVMLLADAGAGAITLGFLLLFLSGELHIWHLYLGEALTGFCEAFQRPAYNASMSVLVSREQLGRANGLRSLSYETTNILSPVLGGLLLVPLGLAGIMVIDLITFGAAVITLLIVWIPRPVRSAEGQAADAAQGWRALTFGMRYIAQRPGLLGLTLIFAQIHLLAALTYFGILAPMVLARGGNDELALSGVQAAMGVGGVVGGLIMTIWGGPRKRIHGVLAFCAASFLFGDLLFAVGRNATAWIAAGFTAAVFIPFIGSSNTAIWQAKVPQDVQGRVLGAAFALQQMTRPVGYLLAGPLADRIFEPALMPGGALSGSLGWLVGTGAGAGMGLMFLGTATLGFVSCMSGYLWPALRNVESDLPDADVVEVAVIGGDERVIGGDLLPELAAD
ncbi:MAG: MFS transporter [Anaerolineae bacterium]|nr:MFS transporter [Anaerolineae bacterium]